ncbi:MAG: transposase [Trichodesmium sp. MAG_R03]|nr:transposase [Trichodesmium sp. MAG_R03]
MAQALSQYYFFNQVLADLAKHFGNRENKHMILVLDRAGWHSSQKLKIPEGLHLEFLPAYTPERQTAERLWPIINEPISNQTFENLSQM